MRLRFSSAAHCDILEAREWYSNQAPGLDLVFREELNKTLDTVRTHPMAFPVVHKAVRRANLRRFPYGVFYVERKDYLFVLGVVHHARSPETWKRRS